MHSATRANTSIAPDVANTLTSIGFRRSNLSRPEVLLTVESSAFTNSVLKALNSQDADVTTLVLSVKPIGSQSASQWSAFMVHATKQLFITSLSPLPLCKQSLVAILDMAEQLGVSEAFVCIARDTSETSALTSEFTSMGFKILSPRLQPLSKFVVLRFDF